MNNMMEKSLLNNIKDIVSKDSVMTRYNLSTLRAKDLTTKGISDEYTELLKKFRFTTVVKQGTISSALALPLLLTNPLASATVVATLPATIAGSLITSVSMCKGVLIALNMVSAEKILKTFGSVKKSMPGIVHCKTVVKSVNLSKSYLISIKNSEGDVKVISVNSKDYEQIRENDEIVAFTLDNKTIHILKLS